MEPLTETQTIRVLLVEDNDVFRQALILLLELQRGIDVVGSSGAERSRL